MNVLTPQEADRAWDRWDRYCTQRQSEIAEMLASGRTDDFQLQRDATFYMARLKWRTN